MLPAAVGLHGLGFRREQIRARAGLAHADDEAQLAAADARQDVLLDVFGCVFEQNRPALPVGDKMRAHRRVCYAEFLGDDVALEKIALAPAVFLRPCHADPAFGADAAAEGPVVAVTMARPIGYEGAGGDLLGDKGAHVLAQRFAFARQPDLVEAEIGAHVIAMPVAARIGRCRGWRSSRRVWPPNSFRCRNRRASPACAA